MSKKRYTFYVDDNGINVYVIPELKGTDVEISDEGTILDMIDWPCEEIDEDEIDEYMEENECDRDEAISALEEESLMAMPTVTIESIPGDDGKFDHVEVAVEEDFDGPHSSCDYVSLEGKLIDDMFEYIMSLVEKS